MAKKQQARKAASRSRISKRQILFYLLSVIIVLSMVLAFLISVLPNQAG